MSHRREPRQRGCRGWEGAEHPGGDREARTSEVQDSVEEREAPETPGIQGQWVI